MNRTPLIARPTIIVWTMALFSSDIRMEAANNGQWIAGWFQAVLIWLPTIAGLAF
tara:strand:- start:45872 stop:46036 length:165 start_codon:yes stop_codon:yes gene_type:complete